MRFLPVFFFALLLFCFLSPSLCQEKKSCKNSNSQRPVAPMNLAIPSGGRCGKFFNVGMIASYEFPRERPPTEESEIACATYVRGGIPYGPPSAQLQLRDGQQIFYRSGIEQQRILAEGRKPSGFTYSDACQGKHGSKFSTMPSNCQITIFSDEWSGRCLCNPTGCTPLKHFGPLVDKRPTNSEVELDEAAGEITGASEEIPQGNSKLLKLQVEISQQ